MEKKEIRNKRIHLALKSSVVKAIKETAKIKGLSVTKYIENLIIEDLKK